MPHAIMWARGIQTSGRSTYPLRTAAWRFVARRPPQELLIGRDCG
jgi:hypothetical protein